MPSYFKQAKAGVAQMRKLVEMEERTTGGTEADLQGTGGGLLLPPARRQPAAVLQNRNLAEQSTPPCQHTGPQVPTCSATWHPQPALQPDCCCCCTPLHACCSRSCQAAAFALLTSQPTLLWWKE